MATTSNTYTGNGSNKLFSITFPYLDTSDVDVYLNGTLQTITTQYTFANATTVEFVAAPANGAVVLLDRSTDDQTLQATFFPGSSIKAADLNENFDQTLYVVQEINNKAVKVDDPLYANKTYIDAQDATKVNKSGDTMSGNLAMAGNKITDLGTTSNANDAATKTYVDNNALLYSGSPGFTQDGTGAVTRSWSSKLKDVVSVKDFGAVGDGVADDTVAIQAAIDSLTGLVYFPDGTYITTSTLILNNTSQILQGTSRYGVTIAADFQGGAVVQIQKARCSIFDVSISTKAGSNRRNASPLGKTAPDASVQGNSLDHGIVILETPNNNTYTNISRVDIVYQPAYGLALFGSASGTIIEQVGVSYCGGHGMYFDNGGKLGTTLTRNGLVDIKSCVIQECWGDGVAIGIYGPNTCFRYRLINLDIFNNCKGDGGTNQPAFYTTGGAEIEALCEQLLIDSCAVGYNPRGIALGVSNSVIISNTRIVSITDIGVLINPDCNRVQIINPYCIGTLPSVGFRVQTNCQNVELNGAQSSEWGLLIDAESEVRVLIDNQEAKTIPGSNSLFYETSTVTSTVSSGILNIQGKLISAIGQGNTTDLISSFRFDSSVGVPDGYIFTVHNLQSYNLILQDRTVLGSGNLELLGTNATLGPNKSMSFIANGGVYYAINRGI
jgi:hypothetical protein